LGKIRSLIFDNRNDEAEKLMDSVFVCRGKGSGYGRGKDLPYGSYQIFADLDISFPLLKGRSPDSYSRILDIEKGEEEVDFIIGEKIYKRKYFCSYADDIGVVRLESPSGDSLIFDISLRREERSNVCADGNEIYIYGNLSDGFGGEGITYFGEIRVLISSGGRCSSVDGKKLSIFSPGPVTLLIALNTSYGRKGRLSKVADKQISAISGLPFGKIESRHIEKFSELMDRFDLSLKGSPSDSASSISERLIRFQKDGDPALAALYLQFGRYLAVSSSRPGSLPANLQGIWCKDVQPPWNADFHLNINLQMNYWLVNETNLDELNRPLCDFVKSIRRSGRRTARVYYRAGGWVTHILGNPWNFTAPGEDPSWGSTNTCAAWLMNQLYTRYIYNRDKKYLKEVYPYMKGAAKFFCSSMVIDPRSGYLVNVPSISPENSFRMKDGTSVHVCAGTTMDNQIISQLYENIIEASGVLRRNGRFVRNIRKELSLIRPATEGDDGRIMEWAFPYGEVDVHHRHVSHLYGLYPGRQISYYDNPSLIRAAGKTLEVRGDESTGWSMAWKINLQAKLHDGEHAYKLLKNLLIPLDPSQNRGGTYPNLFCSHPPFQIDGNFGTAEGIMQMFVQSENGMVDLLPACPRAFSSGSLRGVRLVGGAVLDMVWKDGHVSDLHISSTVPYDGNINVNGKIIHVNIGSDSDKKIKLK
ncbi:MAG: glycoside hydrolase family 95 protein, partial [Bacteroidales bacterium]|nr:glycoside hydrolase family 95 protein [Bacteroidales bacterium]